MEQSMFAFAEDLPELDRILGLGRDLTVAAAYHRARDVTPHGRSRVTVRYDGVHFEPGAEFGRLRPPEQDGPHLLAEARRRTAERGLRMHGWAVFLHSTTLGLRHPDVTQENCFGDRAAPADLCPSHPDVREYAVALARSVARLGVDSVVAESLHFGFFAHGYHHERSFVRLGPAAEFALGLCFCRHCDPPAETRTEAVRLVESVFAGETVDALPAALTKYARSRAETVTSLVAEVAEAVAREGSELVFLDLAGALKGYADGRPTGGLAVDAAWQVGVDPAAVASAAHGYAVLAYARDPARVAADVSGYRAVVDGPLRAVLRPGLPDTDSAAHLAAKINAAGAADAVDFYAYGLLPDPVLDRLSRPARESP